MTPAVARCYSGVASDLTRTRRCTAARSKENLMAKAGTWQLMPAARLLAGGVPDSPFVRAHLRRMCS